MSRVIKFRAWCKSMALMLDWGVSKDDITDAIPYSMGGEYTEDHVVMQFTGIKDTNGKEVYEGDIVTISWLSPSDRRLIVCSSKLYCS